MIKGTAELLALIEKDKNLLLNFDECSRLNSHLNVSGLCEQEKGYFFAALAERSSKKPVIVVADPARARVLAGALAPFIDGDTVVLQPREMSLVNALASSRDTESERLGVVCRIVENDFGAAIICAGALLNKMPKKKTFVSHTMLLKLTERVDPSQLAAELSAIGYERVGMVSVAGEFSWRGDVIDVFSPDSSEPVRLSFFDDEIDQIKHFDIDSQRSSDTLKKVNIMPAREIIIDEKESAARAMYTMALSDAEHMRANSKSTTADLLLKNAASDSDLVRNGMRLSGIEKWLAAVMKDYDSILDYLDRNLTMLFADELMEIRARADSYTADYVSRCKAAFETGGIPKSAFDSVIAIPDMMKALDNAPTIGTSCLKASGNGFPGGKTHVCQGLAGDSYRGNESALVSIIKESSFARNDKHVVLMITGKQRTENLVSRLVLEGASPVVIDAPLPSGFVYPEIGLRIVGEQDVFGAEKTIKKPKKNGSPITLFSDLVPGDYVVHDAHGIGRYEGLVNMRVGNSSQDYLKITYSKEAVLYITMNNLDAIQKYVGPNGKEPKLSNLDSREWEKSVERAKSSIKTVAFDLVKLYAARRANRGFACGPDDVWQTEFEENFPYVETDDQLMAIKDIKRDMESDVPMDRLLCGDVGFGKTEVAFRAMFKCVENGHQAFMLAPTTLLAQQHYENFKKRLGTFPVKVALLSRFVPAEVVRKTIKDIKEGTVDVVIGTHRLLSKDVSPNKLGLLVVDEEQRFGVNHKERIKALRNNIDVLTLTATPIPRTLHMSMSGIRDISVLDEAPMNRRPVQTYVMSYDEEVVVQACMREISRKGQVFYLYNRTADIDKKAEKLSSLMPGARVLYAHGKMSEHQLESIITSFVEGEADILVCTTIIESGVDMPHVNTMIVEDGDRFGLAQLYQIKGRVGRSDRQAYAYITYDPEKTMNSDARKRLMAIREFTELGSGIKIALRDLEVRGAGNLLGAEQHGQMDVIGYELYCRLLDEEIRRLRENGDEVLKMPITASVEIDHDTYIPAAYISDEESRMAAYRRISSISTDSDHQDFLDEIIDRYGEPPTEVMTLACVSLIRNKACIAGFDRVILHDDAILLYFAQDRKINMKAVSELVASDGFAGNIMLNATGKPYIRYSIPKARKSKFTDDAIRMLNILTSNS